MQSGRLWPGLLFVLFPLGRLLYGVNDLTDVAANQLNPRKGTYMFGGLLQHEGGRSEPGPHNPGREAPQKLGSPWANERLVRLR